MYTRKLYSYNITLLSHHSLVLHNQTKTHTLIFYLMLVLKVANSNSFLLPITFYEKHCSMKLWYWYKIIPSSFCCDKFNISVFLYFSLFFFSKVALFINLMFAFISIHGFSQVFWLNLFTLWTYLWCNVCFKFLLWTSYSIVSCKLTTSQLFQFSFFLIKKVDHCENLVIFQYNEHQL